MPLAARWRRPGAMLRPPGQLQPCRRRGLAARPGRSTPAGPGGGRHQPPSSTQKAVINRLARLRAGERTAGLERATAAGQTNPGVALAFLSLTFGGRVGMPAARRHEWPADGSAEWCREAVTLLDAGGLKLRSPRPFVWLLTQCAKAEAPAAPAAVVLELAEAAGAPPSVQLYSALINVAAKQRGGSDLGLALQTYARMQAEGVRCCWLVVVVVVVVVVGCVCVCVFVFVFVVVGGWGSRTLALAPLHVALCAPSAATPVRLPDLSAPRGCRSNRPK